MLFLKEAGLLDVASLEEGGRAGHSCAPPWTWVRWPVHPVIYFSQQPCDVRNHGPSLQMSKASLPEAKEAVTPESGTGGSHTSLHPPVSPLTPPTVEVPPSPFSGLLLETLKVPLSL